MHPLDGIKNYLSFGLIQSITLANITRNKSMKYYSTGFENPMDKLYTEA